MKTKHLFLKITVITTAWLMIPALQAAERADYKGIAERIVGQSANVKEGDRVVISGDVRDMDLIEELALACWKRGAEPLQVIGREKAARRYFDEVPEKYDAMPLSLSLKLVEASTVAIWLSGQEFPALLNDVAPERASARAERSYEAYKVGLKRGVRGVEIGNGLYPTEATAERYGLKKNQLADLFWGGINVDYKQLRETGATLRSILSAGKEVRITQPNGTDIKFRIEGRPVFVTDGVISEEASRTGGPGTQVYLPAGEVFVTPVPGSAEGKIVFDALPAEAGVIVGATFTVKGGKLTAHSAQPGPLYERWKKNYEAAPEGRNQVSWLDFGINPHVKVPPGSKLTCLAASGAVSVGLGGNVWAGGENDIGWATAGALHRCTATVDGKTVVEDGALKLP